MFPDMVNTMFYAGLALLIVGNGLFKPNISTMVGDLYEEGDHRRDGAFTIFYMGINLGSLLAGVICGAAATAYRLASCLRRRRYRYAALSGDPGHHGPAFPG